MDNEDDSFLIDGEWIFQFATSVVLNVLNTTRRTSSMSEYVGDKANTLGFNKCNQC